MLDHLCKLMAHQCWADAVFFDCWRSSPGLLENEDLRKRVTHIAIVQEGFRKLIAEEPVSRPPQAPLESFAVLENRMRASGAALDSLVAGFNEERLANPLRIPWFQEKPCVISIAEALVQVAMHSQHHRGQCMTVLKQLGGTPKNVDWIIWLWNGKPGARWP